MSMEREGGTSARADQSVYGAAALEYERGSQGLRRGQLVSIAGEPGLHAYRVVAIDQMHGRATICREHSTRESWCIPVAALEPLE